MKDRLRKTCLAIAALGVALLLSACSSRTAAKLGAVESDPMPTSSLTPKDTGGPSFRHTRDLANAWQQDQANVKLGSQFAKSLADLGQVEQQIQVLSTVAQLNRSKPDVQAQIGKELLKLGKSEQAVPMLEIAAAAPEAKWQTLSALGTAYDEQGRYKLAQDKYRLALKLSPNESAVMNNLAMSHSLDGDLKQAEKILREAMQSPGAKNYNKLRQNLALIVGLQSRFDEARKIASADLPPDQVEANLAYLEQMLSQQNTWAKLQDADTEPAQ
jgi:Flp pilus assembly protein TadD